MSYIINTSSPFVSVKMTDYGRQMLAKGQLNYTYWAVGDSEINYAREDLVDNNQTNPVLSASSMVLRPVDVQPNFTSFVKKKNAAVPLNLLNSTNTRVIKAVVSNQAEERGFFTHSGTGFTHDYTLAVENKLIQNTAISGTSKLVFSGATEAQANDFLLLRLHNSTVGNAAAGDTTKAVPNFWYKIKSVSGSTFTLDRALPNMSADTAYSEFIVYVGGEVYNGIGDTYTSAYWDTGTLSFNSSVNVSCHDVPVLNMNNVWCENLAGMSGGTTYENYTKFGSYQYLGLKYPYLNYPCQSDTTETIVNCDGTGIVLLDDVSKSLGVIHYTNNTISNMYGEFFNIEGSAKPLKIHLPNIMYHRRSNISGSGSTMGMSFVASGSTYRIGSTEIDYIDLIEDANYLPSGCTQQVVGKVLPQYKMVVFDDDEIIAAMSYKSNRNWTLPELSAMLSNPTGGTSNGILNPDDTIYVTYVLTNSETSGLTNNLPCQKYIKLTNNTTSAKDVSFKINDLNLLGYMHKKEKGGYDGKGFYATNFKVMYQIVNTPSDRPVSNAWKTIDMTTTLITSGAGETIDPGLLENQNPVSNGFVITQLNDATATVFDLTTHLGLPATVNYDDLQFGDERFFYGNLETHIGATIYKTMFDIKFTTGTAYVTSNPTRAANAVLPRVKVSEVGIYDKTKTLVAVGKLSRPIKLEPNNTILMEVSLDF